VEQSRERYFFGTWQTVNAFPNSLGTAEKSFLLEVCKEQGHRIVIVVGHPHFYQRFGFSPELAAPLESPFSGRESFMAVELIPGALGGVTGRVVYPPPFGAWE
jgi:putative acetyltransferase